jgi:hypothetical protein
MACAPPKNTGLDSLRVENSGRDSMFEFPGHQKHDVISAPAKDSQR